MASSKQRSSRRARRLTHERARQAIHFWREMVLAGVPFIDLGDVWHVALIAPAEVRPPEPLRCPIAELVGESLAR
jgi:hypothetical protein